LRGGAVQSRLSAPLSFAGADSWIALFNTSSTNSARICKRGSESLVQDLDKSFPLDTQLQGNWLPAIRAQLALNRKNPASALETLRIDPSLELGQIDFERERRQVRCR